MDLTKLSPAPWKPDGIDARCVVTSGGPISRLFVVQSADPRLSDDEANVNAEFIALARNAFDVMMRRQDWQIIWIGEWCVVSLFDILDRETHEIYMKAVQQRFTEPFTAFVEADKWYKENIEANAPHQQ